MITDKTILAPKLLVNLRTEYYSPAGTFSGQYHLTWNAAESRLIYRNDNRHVSVTNIIY